MRFVRTALQHPINSATVQAGLGDSFGLFQSGVERRGPPSWVLRFGGVRLLRRLRPAFAHKGNLVPESADWRESHVARAGRQLAPSWGDRTTDVHVS